MIYISFQEQQLTQIELSLIQDCMFESYQKYKITSCQNDQDCLQQYDDRIKKLYNCLNSEMYTDLNNQYCKESTLKYASSMNYCSNLCQNYASEQTKFSNDNAETGWQQMVNYQKQNCLPSPKCVISNCISCQQNNINKCIQCENLYQLKNEGNNVICVKSTECVIDNCIECKFNEDVECSLCNEGFQINQQKSCSLIQEQSSDKISFFIQSSDDPLIYYLKFGSNPQNQYNYYNVVSQQMEVIINKFSYIPYNEFQNIFGNNRLLQNNNNSSHLTQEFIFTYIISQEQENGKSFIMNLQFSQSFLSSDIFMQIRFDKNDFDSSHSIIQLQSYYKLSSQQIKQVNQIKTAAKIQGNSLAPMQLGNAVAAGDASGSMSGLYLGLIEINKFQKVSYTPQLIQLFKNSVLFPNNLFLDQNFISADIKDLSKIPSSVSKWGSSPYFISNTLDYQLQILIWLIIAIIIKQIVFKIQEQIKNKKKLKYVIDLITFSFVWNIVFIQICNRIPLSVFYCFINAFYIPLYSWKGIILYIINIIFLAIHLILPFFIINLIKCSINLQNKRANMLNECGIKIPDEEQELEYKPSKLFPKWLERVLLTKDNLPEIEIHLFIQRYLFFYKFSSGRKSFNGLSVFIVPLYIIRIYLVALIIATLINYPLISTLICLFINIIFFFLVMFLKSYRLLFIYIFQIIIELFILLSFIGCFLFALMDTLKIENINARIKIGNYLVISSMIVGYSQTIFLTIGLYLFIYVTKYCNRKKQQQFDGQETIRSNFNDSQIEVELKQKIIKNSEL